MEHQEYFKFSCGLLQQTMLHVDYFNTYDIIPSNSTLKWFNYDNYHRYQSHYPDEVR